jgi:hypothetical protein
MLEQAIFDNPAQRRFAAISRIKLKLTGCQRIPHTHAPIRAGTRREHVGPDTQILEQGHGVGGEGDHARIDFVLDLPCRWRSCLDQGDIQAIADEGQGHGRSGDAGTDHDHIQFAATVHRLKPRCETSPRKPMPRSATRRLSGARRSSALKANERSTRKGGESLPIKRTRSSLNEVVAARSGVRRST